MQPVDTTSLMGKRDGYKLFVEPDEKAEMDRLLDDMGLKQYEAITRIIRWFLDQPDVLQRGMLKLLPPTMASEITRMTLQRLSEGAKKPSLSAPDNVTEDKLDSGLKGAIINDPTLSGPGSQPRVPKSPRGRGRKPRGGA